MKNGDQMLAQLEIVTEAARRIAAGSSPCWTEMADRIAAVLAEYPDASVDVVVDAVLGALLRTHPMRDVNDQLRRVIGI